MNWVSIGSNPLSSAPPGTNFSEIWNSIQKFSLKKVYLNANALFLCIVCWQWIFDLQIRDEEQGELDTHLQSCFLDVAGGAENTYGKVNILLQSYISQTRMENFSLVSDQAYVAQVGSGTLMKYTQHSGPSFNFIMSTCHNRKSHCGDKMIRSSYLHSGISYAGKMTSSYWIISLLCFVLLGLRYQFLRICVMHLP